MAPVHGLTVDRIAKQRIAKEMSDRTGLEITADMVRVFDRNPGMNIYAAQSHHATVLCRVSGDEFDVKVVWW